MYRPAVEMGIDADKYWSMSYEEIVVQAEANKKIKERELLEKSMFDYKLSQLNAYAFNSPKEMPKFETHYPFSIDVSSERKQVDVPAEQQLSAEDKRWITQRAQFAQVARQIKETKKRKGEGGG